MIWPFCRKQKEVDIVPTLTEVIIKDNNGTSWRYKPVRHITALEVAKLLPVFDNTGVTVNQWQYIVDNKLQRNFERVE